MNSENVAKARPSKNLQEAIESADERFSSSDPTDTIRSGGFYFQWNDFRGMRTTFGQRDNLTFFFQERGFEVTFALYKENDSGTAKTVFESGYNLLIDQAQIHEINYQLANKVYDFITAKLAEADTPPA